MDSPRAEFYVEHNPPARRAETRQYVYDIGSYHYNWHPQIELLVILGGKVELCTAGGVAVLGRGDVAVLNSNEGHATMSLEAGPGASSAQALLLHLDPDYVSSFNSGVIPHFACRSTPRTQGNAEFRRLRATSARLMEEGLKAGPAAAARREALLAEIVATLFESFHDPAVFPVALMGEEGYVEVLRRATGYIEEHYRERLTLKQLAQRAGYSPTYFSEIFSSHMGIPLSEHITRVRLAQAVRMLGETDLTITDVARESGFPDVKAFGVAFKRAFNKTASQYRRQLRELAERGVDLGQVDETFHERFAHRADESVAATLREFAHPEEHLGDHPGPHGGGVSAEEHRRVLEQVRELGEQAALVGERLARLADG